MVFLAFIGITSVTAVVGCSHIQASSESRRGAVGGFSTVSEESYACKRRNCTSACSVLRCCLRSHCDHHGPGAQGTRGADILGPMASMAHGHQLCGQLPVHRHHLDQPPLPGAVRGSSHVGVDLD